MSHTTQNSQFETLVSPTTKKRKRRSAEELLAASKRQLAKAQVKVAKETFKNDPEAAKILANLQSLRTRRSQIKAILKPDSPNNIERRYARAVARLEKLQFIRDHSDEAIAQLDQKIREIQASFARLYEERTGTPMDLSVFEEAPAAEENEDFLEEEDPNESEQ